MFSFTIHIFARYFLYRSADQLVQRVRLDQKDLGDSVECLARTENQVARDHKVPSELLVKPELTVNPEHLVPTELQVLPDLQEVAIIVRRQEQHLDIDKN